MASVEYIAFFHGALALRTRVCRVGHTITPPGVLIQKFDCGISTEIDFEALRVDLGLSWCKTLLDLCAVGSPTPFDALGSR
jgi:hypothetical protein